ncbi:hypothetical protein [Streptomyces luteireticuli]|uniref:Cation-transporting P-type ATPase N-terminal domain-containing protein n=1 Tax=Streptomyces luteireticuli TaxID=173858 RepID=A0ABP3IIZ9_9ACTN
MGATPKRGRHRGMSGSLPLEDFARQHPMRLYAVAAATVALIAQYVTVPEEAILTLVAALLGVGEFTQRIEDRKTLEALLRLPPAVPVTGENVIGFPQQ